MLKCRTCRTVTCRTILPFSLIRFSQHECVTTKDQAGKIVICLKYICIPRQVTTTKCGVHVRKARLTCGTAGEGKIVIDVLGYDHLRQNFDKQVGPSSSDAILLIRWS